MFPSRPSNSSPSTRLRRRRPFPMIYNKRPMRHYSHYFGPILAILLLHHRHLPTVHSSKVQCTSNDECRALLLPESECINGYCSNPFQRGGCLKNMMPGWNKLRICNSEDPIDAAELGYCREPVGFAHDEVRILTQNWESSYFASWLLQIILSEILDVPVTLETGTADAELNFYHPESPFDFGTSNDWTAFISSNEVKDCRVLSSNINTRHRRRVSGRDFSATARGDQEAVEEGGGASIEKVYTSCAHVCPEVWDERLPRVRELADQGHIDPSIVGSGALGQYGWYVPKFTAARDPTLVSYLGLAGEANREKLAETFLRPTRWGEYCDNHSNITCRFDDGVATRAPINKEERNRFYAEGLYKGYFRKTEKNICGATGTNNETTLDAATGTNETSMTTDQQQQQNCTGHIADFPCDWIGHMYAQLHHLDIPLEGDGTEPYIKGYSYNELADMLLAANATKSNLIFQWWTPEATSERFVGTDTELVRVSLTKTSQSCVSNRIKPEERCSSDMAKRVGDPVGSCDDITHILHKVLSPVLHQASTDPQIPQPMRSPAYEAIRLFQLSSYQYGEIFEKWLGRNIDQMNYDPRHATCEWFVENFDYMEGLVPKTYPRAIQEQSVEGPLYIAALIVSGLATILVIASMFVMYRHRTKRAIRYAQFEFLCILLVGLLIISAGAVVSALATIPNSDVSCIAVAWLVNLGYTLELVPLIVKVAALNQLAQAASRLQRLKLSMKRLFEGVLFLTVLCIIFLTCWTIFDPPYSTAEYTLTSDTNEDGATIVTETYHCSWGKNRWRYGALAWNFAYLIVATVLAYQTRKVVQAFNESQVLAFMIYSHFIFAMLQVASFFLERSLDQRELAWFRSLIFSCDVIATIFIYFLPKFILAHSEGLDNSSVYVSVRLSQIVQQAFRRSVSQEHHEYLDQIESAQPPVYPALSSRHYAFRRARSGDTTIRTSATASALGFRAGSGNRMNGGGSNTNISSTESSRQLMGGGGGGGSGSQRHQQPPPPPQTQMSDAERTRFLASIQQNRRRISNLQPHQQEILKSSSPDSINDDEILAVTDCLLSLDSNQENPTISGGFEQLVFLLGADDNHDDDDDNDSGIINNSNSNDTSRRSIGPPTNDDETIGNRRNDNGSTSNLVEPDTGV